ncbi:MAG: transposase [Deltaproteobacteria bacterium]|nr:transposase [Deltaproteobacteria bacterium]
MAVMPSRPRQLGPHLCYHVRVQCNNRAFRFESVSDFQQYLAILFTARDEQKFLLHHFMLMHTHVHLLITTPGPIFLDRIMQRINHRYAIDYHTRHQRTGHFWMHGYRCAIVDSDRYALACMRYLDRNPIRAGVVTDPSEWPWSGHRFYAFGDREYLLDSHESYLGMANEQGTRQSYYRTFCLQHLPADDVREQKTIRQAMVRYGRVKS